MKRLIALSLVGMLLCLGGCKNSDDEEWIGGTTSPHVLYHIDTEDAQGNLIFSDPAVDGNITYEKIGNVLQPQVLCHVMIREPPAREPYYAPQMFGLRLIKLNSTGKQT